MSGSACYSASTRKVGEPVFETIKARPNKTIYALMTDGETRFGLYTVMAVH
jgi:hypothetical protein